MKRRGSGIAGYNVQAAADVEHHLSVAHEVTNVGIHRRQLSPMSIRARLVVAPDSADPLTVIADHGYYRGEALLACEEANIIAYVPKSDPSGKRSKGECNRNEFRYIADDDEYECPAGEQLRYRFTRAEAGKKIRRDWALACVRCPIRSQCTPSNDRRISRWEHEVVVEAAEARLADHPYAVRIRRATVEHPFGMLKAWVGSTHSLAKPLG
jgi:hypothetical protein